EALHHEPKIVEARAGQHVAAAVCVSLSWTRNGRFSGVITILSSRASQPIAHSKNGVFPFTSFFNWLRDNSPSLLSTCQIWPATVPISSCTDSSFCDTVKNKGGAGLSRSRYIVENRLLLVVHGGAARLHSLRVGSVRRDRAGLPVGRHDDPTARSH